MKQTSGPDPIGSSSTSSPQTVHDARDLRLPVAWTGVLNVEAGQDRENAAQNKELADRNANKAGGGMRDPSHHSAQAFRHFLLQALERQSQDCSATIRMRARVASSRIALEPIAGCLTPMFPKAQLSPMLAARRRTPALSPFLRATPLAAAARS